MEYVIRYSLKPKRAGEYRRWLLGHQAQLEAAVPEGWTYLGTYFTVRSLGPHDCETRWELRNYAAMDNRSEAQGKLTAEIAEFLNENIPAVGALLKSAADVLIVE